MCKGAPFGNITLRPFPVRAAFDIGTDGHLSLAIGRVDATHRSIRDLLHHVQLPLHLQYQAATRRPMIDESTQRDIVTKMRILQGVLKRPQFRGVTEVGGLLSYPLCHCDNAADFAAELCKEFKVNMKVLTKSYVPSGDLWGGAMEQHQVTRDGQGIEYDLNILKFQSAAASSRCVARHRMLYVNERTPHGVIEVSGVAHHNAAESLRLEETAFAAQAVEGREKPALLTYRLPVTAIDAHRILLGDVQRRDADVANAPLDQKGVPSHSPNPVLRTEFRRLVAALEGMIAPTIPQWVTEKSMSGGVICGDSTNGGLLNVGSRVTQHTMMSLERLVNNAEFHYCGLTDVLIGENYPYPQLVVPQAALCVAVLRSLHTPRLHYLTDMSPAFALLVSRELWAFDRKVELVEKLKKRKFFHSAKHRTFDVPRSQAFFGQPSV